MTSDRGMVSGMIPVDKRLVIQNAGSHNNVRFDTRVSGSLATLSGYLLSRLVDSHSEDMVNKTMCFTAEILHGEHAA